MLLCSKESLKHLKTINITRETESKTTNKYYIINIGFGFKN